MTPEIDHAILGSLLATIRNPDEMRTLIELFSRTFETRSAEMTKALGARNAVALKSAAHALKGSCYMFGGLGCAKVCAGIEDSATRLDFGHARDEFAALGREMAEFITAISKLTSPSGARSPDDSGKQTAVENKFNGVM